MDKDTSKPFDAAVASEELRTSTLADVGPRLSFQDKCAAFWCLYVGQKPARVAKAFGISDATISHLKQASAPKPGRQARYPDVKREFDRLGAEGFRDAYYTDDVHTRMMRLKYDAAHTGDDRRLSGPNPKADKYAFDNYGVIETKSGELWRIDWIGGGWHFVDVPDRNGIWIAPRDGGTRLYMGAEKNDPFDSENPMPARRPFNTSSAAHQGLLVYVGDR